MLPAGSPSGVSDGTARRSVAGLECRSRRCDETRNTLARRGNIGTRENKLEVARLDYSLRFDWVFSSDHIAWPNPESIRSNYS